ncbi:hypothetical protein HK096_011284, partial [Nowakowskiella sp. JEL0078]
MELSLMNRVLSPTLLREASKHDIPLEINGMDILEGLISSIETSCENFDRDPTKKLHRRKHSPKQVNQIKLNNQQQVNFKIRHNLPIDFLHLLFSYLPQHHTSSVFIIALTCLLASINTLFIIANFISSGLPYLIFLFTSQIEKIDISMEVPFTSTKVSLVSGTTDGKFSLQVFIVMLEMFLLLFSPAAYIYAHHLALSLYPPIYVVYEAIDFTSCLSAFRLVLFLNTQYVVNWIRYQTAESRAVDEWRNEDFEIDFKHKRKVPISVSIIALIAAICGAAAFALKLQQVKLIPTFAPWDSPWSIREYLNVAGLIINVAGLMPRVHVFDKLATLGIDSVRFSAEYKRWAEHIRDVERKKIKIGEISWFSKYFGKAVWDFMTFKISTTENDLQLALVKSVKKCRS